MIESDEFIDLGNERSQGDRLILPHYILVDCEPQSERPTAAADLLTVVMFYLVLNAILDMLYEAVQLLSLLHRSWRQLPSIGATYTLGKIR